MGYGLASEHRHREAETLSLDKNLINNSFLKQERKKKRFVEMETAEADNSDPWLQPRDAGGRNERLRERGSLIFMAASGTMLPGDSNENRASSRSNGTAAATSIPPSPEMRSLSFANTEALVAWLSFQKVTKRYANEMPIFLGLTPTRFLAQLCLQGHLLTRQLMQG